MPAVPEEEAAAGGAAAAAAEAAEKEVRKKGGGAGREDILLLLLLLTFILYIQCPLPRKKKGGHLRNPQGEREKKGEKGWLVKREGSRGREEEGSNKTCGGEGRVEK